MSLTSHPSLRPQPVACSTGTRAHGRRPWQLPGVSLQRPGQPQVKCMGVASDEAESRFAAFVKRPDPRAPEPPSSQQQQEPSPKATDSTDLAAEQRFASFISKSRSPAAPSSSVPKSGPKHAGPAASAAPADEADERFAAFVKARQASNGSAAAAAPSRGGNGRTPAAASNGASSPGQPRDEVEERFGSLLNSNKHRSGSAYASPSGNGRSAESAAAKVSDASNSSSSSGDASGSGAGSDVRAEQQPQVLQGSSDPPKVLFSSAESQAFAFTALSSTSALLAGVCLAVPDLVLTSALPSLQRGPLDETFLRVAGATLLLSAAVEYCLKAAVDGKRIKSATYQRLMTACIYKSAAYVAVLTLYRGTFLEWNVSELVAYPSLALTALYIQSSVLSNTSGNGFTLPSFEFGLPKNPPAWGYSLFMVLYAATAAACFAPEMMFVGGFSPATPLLKAIWAPGFLLAAFVCYVLKDAADRERLSASTFRNLNLGLFLLEAAYGSIFGFAVYAGLAELNDVSIPNLGGSATIALFALANYLFNAPKKDAAKKEGKEKPAEAK